MAIGIGQSVKEWVRQSTWPMRKNCITLSDRGTALHYQGQGDIATFRIYRRDPVQPLFLHLHHRATTCPKHDLS